MDSATIPGGYILLARKILRNFWARPAFHAKLWLYILLKANHKELEMRGVKLKRGQVLTTLKKLSAAAGHFVGARAERPSIPQVSKTLKSFAEEGMIATHRMRRNILITVINYGYYQNPENYRVEPRTQDMTARDILLAKERRQATKQQKEEALIEMVEHYWSLHSMGLEESAMRHRNKMVGMVEAGDLPSDAIQTLDEIVALREERIR